MIIECHNCGKKVEKPSGAVNRSKKIGAPLYCSRKCSGLARRVKKSDAQKKEEKRLYDIAYRKKNADRIEKDKQRYCETPAGRAMQKRNRDKRKEQHLEYCRTPEYKAWKKEYDRQYRARKEYGEYGPAFVALRDLENEIDPREGRRLNNLHTKSTQKRKRSWQALTSSTQAT